MNILVNCSTKKKLEKIVLQSLEKDNLRIPEINEYQIMNYHGGKQSFKSFMKIGPAIISR